MLVFVVVAIVAVVAKNMGYSSVNTLANSYVIKGIHPLLLSNVYNPLSSVYTVTAIASTSLNLRLFLCLSNCIYIYSACPSMSTISMSAISMYVSVSVFVSVLASVAVAVPLPFQHPHPQLHLHLHLCQRLDLHLHAQPRASEYTLYAVSNPSSTTASEVSLTFHTLTTPSQPPVAIAACARARLKSRLRQPSFGSGFRFPGSKATRSPRAARTQIIRTKNRTSNLSTKLVLLLVIRRGAFCYTWTPAEPFADPGAAAGAHETALQPIWCAL